MLYTNTFVEGMLYTKLWWIGADVRASDVRTPDLSLRGSDSKQLAQFVIGQAPHRQDFVHRRVKLDLAAPFPTCSQLAGTVQAHNMRAVDAEASTFVARGFGLLRLQG